MSRILNEEEACKRVHTALASRKFAPRDADSSDLARKDVPGLRFKVGTVYGEVAVHVLVHDSVTETIRILRDTRVDDRIAYLDDLIDDFVDGPLR